MSNFLKSTDFGILLIRISVSVILLFHGVYKFLNGIRWMEGPLSQVGLPFYIAYEVYIAELLAPILIIIGFRTRLAALIIVFDMFMAVFLVLREQLFAVKEAGGGWGIELEALIFFGALALFFTGGGKYSVSTKSSWD
ncbi:MAG: DoxX family protein [Ignavibacteria bacterium RBG_16_34_14]|nr:MAG: DoxX family protein [Ignavibacteria bacterium RBG_16_34_14]